MVDYIHIANNVNVVRENGKYTNDEVKRCFNVYLRAMEAAEMRFHGISEEVIFKRYHGSH